VNEALSSLHWPSRLGFISTRIALCGRRVFKGDDRRSRRGAQSAYHTCANKYPGIQHERVVRSRLSHMCLQTVADCVGFLGAAARRLASGGVFVISIPHPAFFNEYKQVLPVGSFNYMVEQNALIDFAISLDPLSIIRQVPYFHRSLSYYLSAFANAGLSITYMNEIFPSPRVQALYGGQWKTPRYLLLGGTVTQSVPKLTMAHRLLDLERGLSFRGNRHEGNDL
jgi:hypothetical protein